MTNSKQYVPRKVKYLRKRLKRMTKFGGNFIDTFKAMATTQPELETNYSAVYDLGDDKAFKVTGNKIPDNFNDDMQELGPDTLFESKMIEMRRMWNHIDRGNRGRMNALALEKF